MISVCFCQHMYLFRLSPEGISRLIYPGRPFIESLDISEYIRNKSSPEDTIAVLGSDPQIYFYSRLRSATRYIYTYPLMESHDFAKPMQQQMVAEIESQRPQFIVFVTSHTSWLPLPRSNNHIFIWLEHYLQRLYNIAAVVEISPGSRTIYKSSALSHHPFPAASDAVLIYQRK